VVARTTCKCFRHSLQKKPDLEKPNLVVRLRKYRAVMQLMWSTTKARISNRLAMHLFIAPFQLRNKSPMVSFTFDDAPKSAATMGSRILDEYGARGTYYLAGGLVDKWSGNWTGVSADDILDLHRRGHEIACHTFSHARATDLDAAMMTAEIEKNRRYLTAINPSIKLENFAYPYGLGSISRKTQLGKIFQSTRSIVPGINNGIVDLQYLRATPLIEHDIDCAGVERAYDEAVARNGWLIFYSHDVATEPSRYGCSPSFLRHALDAASRRNIPILSVAEALRLGGVPQSAASI
jgi:peptidoglycan/xylan/chitin deacetylase (PgdA/CDA1 family)